MQLPALPPAPLPLTYFHLPELVSEHPERIGKLKPAHLDASLPPGLP
jgi:hypothetical protein